MNQHFPTNQNGEFFDNTVIHIAHVRIQSSLFLLLYYSKDNYKCRYIDINISSSLSLRLSLCCSVDTTCVMCRKLYVRRIFILHSVPTSNSFQVKYRKRLSGSLSRSRSLSKLILWKDKYDILEKAAGAHGCSLCSITSNFLWLPLSARAPVLQSEILLNLVDETYMFQSLTVQSGSMLYSSEKVESENSAFCVAVVCVRGAVLRRTPGQTLRNIHDP